VKKSFTKFVPDVPKTGRAARGIVLVPKAVSTKSFGRPRAFRVEKARSAPIVGRCATSLSSARMRIESPNERLRPSKAVSVPARY